MNVPINQVEVIAMKTADLRSKLNRGDIPEELKKKKCWLVWETTRLNPETGKFDKVPSYPRSGKRRHGAQGSAEDRRNLGTFEEAMDAFNKNFEIAGIGIALLPEFCIVALDVDRCVVDGKLRDDVAELADSTYCEFSPSGTGIRAFWLGVSRDGKNHESGFELFHSKGFVTVTGNQTINSYFVSGTGIPKLDPDMQEKLENLSRSSGKIGKVSKPELLKEAAKNDPRLKAINKAGLYERDLGNGKHSIQCPFEDQHSDYGRDGGDGDTVYFQPHTNGYSEGWIHCSHTHGNDQSKYWEVIGYNIHAEEFENLETYDSVDDLPDISSKSGLSKPEFDIEYPPGLAGEIAEYIFKSSRMPVKSFAIAAALTTMSQLNANRAYVKKSDTALNLYLCLIGDTGKGKEDPRKAIKRLLDEVKDSLDATIHESISSGAALLRSLESKPNMLILLDEFGLYLQVALSDKGPAHQKEFIKDLMTLYGSGRSFFAGKVYANTNQNIGRIDKPYINLIGTTTPLELFDGINSKTIDNGFLNRFLFIQPSEESPINREPDIQVSKDLKHRMSSILGVFEDHKLIGLDYENGAHDLLVKLVEQEEKKGQLSNLWTRVEEMTIRVAGLLALGDGGVIKCTHVEWAWCYANTSIEAFAQRLEKDLSETLFQKHTAKALDIISKAASKYSSDKQFGKLCKRGYMPRGKLTKLLKVKSKEVDEIVKYLEETEQTARVMVGSVTCFSVL